MKLLVSVVALCTLVGCAGIILTKGEAFQDCITTHLRVIARNNAITQEMYMDIVDSCRQAHTGRP